MEYLRRSLSLTVVVLIVLLVPSVKPQSKCDRKKAELCVAQMEDVITGVLETTTGVSRTEKLQQLCLNVIKGNNLTQCFIEATAGCSEPAQVAPTDVVQRWEKVMQDLYGLCDGACPNFLEKTVNITQCTGIIRFDALYDSSYTVFCNSLNQSLQCVSETSEKCPQFSHLFYDLLPEGMDQTASTICTGGCDNFDQALEMLETCKKYVLDLPNDLKEACVSYENFKTCIRLSEAPVACPMFGSLMEVLYPQHIFGLYEQNCNRSLDDSSVDKCGAIGIARVDHCLRIFALAWPPKPKTPTEQQCRDYASATKCLERAGFGECASLRQYFNGKTEGKQAIKQMMREKCPGVESSGRPLTAWISGTLISLLMSTLLSL
nr:cell wall protein PRY3-like isoform X1 [Biomphalaria glabrata]